MGLIFSIGVIWVTYLIMCNVSIVTISKKPKVKMRVCENSDINAA